MGWFKYLTIFAVVAIFSVCFIAFIVNIENANNAPINILSGNSSLNGLSSSMNGIITNFSTASNIQSQVSANESVVAPTGAFVMFSMLSSLGRFMFMPIQLIGSLFQTLSSVIGIDSGILGLISAIIVLLGIFLWYRFNKIGE